MTAKAVLNRPLLLLNLYLDNDTTSGGTQAKALAGKNIIFHEVQFTARVLEWGTVDRSTSNPPGSIQIDDAEVVLADTDGNVRAWFDAITPFRRLAEIIFDREGNNGETDGMVDGPTTGWITNYTNTPPTPTGPGTNNIAGPISDPYWTPLFTGEIIAVRFQPGKAIIRLQEVTAKLLKWEIPKLITRDNFNNLPDDTNEGASDYTAPIIFGRVLGYSDSFGASSQGVIRCWYIDTHLHRYCVARHVCYSVTAVYRKRKMDSTFKLVDPPEYAINNPVFTIGGISYTFTVIDFTKQQEDGAIISCDVSGINFRYDFTTGAFIANEGEERNFVDAIFNLLFYAANDHPFTQSQPQTYLRFNNQSFIDTRAAMAAFNCDGAITDSMTLGDAISQLCNDSGIDFYENNQAQMSVHYYNPAADSHIPIDNKLVLLKTLEPSLPATMATRIRYRFFRQNSGLLDYVKSASSDHWVYEATIDNVVDQFELAQTGQNPLIEIVDELPFVRDSTTADALMKVRMGYYNLRSYLCEFEVPIPEVIMYLQLSSCITLTHLQGIGPVGTGWAGELMRVFALNFDLKSYRARVKAIVRVSVPDANFQFNSNIGPHAGQPRIPPLPVLINGSLDGGIGPAIDPDGEPQLNIIDADSLIINTLPVPTTFTFGYASSGAISSTGTDSSSDATVVPVKWIEKQTLTPRQAGGYVMIPKAGKFSTSFYVGTLSPDTRPSLGTGDINRAVFYSTDFDHEFLYVGTGESGTPSGWRCIEQTTGNVVLRWDAPISPGWHICDGSTVNKSDYEGTVASYVLPALMPGTDTLLELSATPTDDSTLAAKTLTDNTSLPSCLSATGITVNRVRLMPYMRL